MMALKRILQICVLSACVLSPAAVFADEVALRMAEEALFSPQTAEAPSLQEGIDFGNLDVPEAISLSCTATSQCTPVGGTPVTCTGVTTCSSAANWVTCDNTITPCTCNPAGVPTCYDPVGFCQCWSAAPTYNWGVCRQAFCIEP